MSYSSSSPYYYHYFMWYSPMFHPATYIWLPVQPQPVGQEQEEFDMMNNTTVMQMQSMELLQTPLMQRPTTTYAANNNADSVGESSIIPPDNLGRMMSFLEKDDKDSFLTPWARNSSSFPHETDDHHDTPSFSFGGVKYHQFQPGSFFHSEYPECFF